MKREFALKSSTHVALALAPRRSRKAGTLALSALLCALPGLGACKSDDGVTNKPVAPTERPRRASVAFVRCIEQSGAGCVEMSGQLGAWDAFSVLGWLASGSPLGILRRLPQELAHHSDRNLVLRRFTAAAGRIQQPLRGAECEAKNVIELDPLIPELERAATARLQNIGIWNGDLETVVQGLAKESRGLKGGYIVEMGCMSEPYSFYVATAQDGERQLAVGLLSGLPEFLGGHSPSREIVERSLQAKTLDAGMGAGDSNLIHPWIPVAPEGF